MDIYELKKIDGQLKTVKLDKINLSKFDSTSGYATVNRTLGKSNNNDLLLTNISHIVNFNDEFYTFDYSILDQYKNFLSRFIKKVICPKELYYHPEILAKEIYGSVDLWYLVMMFNPIPSVAEFNSPVVNVFDPAKMHHINTIINSYQKELKYNKADYMKPENKLEKHVLTPVRIKDSRPSR